MEDNTTEQTGKEKANKRITLCGSTKFKKEFEAINRQLSLEGYIVYSVAFFGHADNVPLTKDEKELLDEVHKRKIDNSDAIFVLDVNEYIGESTRSEIEYAESKGKTVKYLSRFPDLKWICDSLLSPPLPEGKDYEQEILIPFPSVETCRDGKEIKNWMDAWLQGYKEHRDTIHFPAMKEKEYKIQKEHTITIEKAYSAIASLTTENAKLRDSLLAFFQWMKENKHRYMLTDENRFVEEFLKANTKTQNP